MCTADVLLNLAFMSRSFRDPSELCGSKSVLFYKVISNNNLYLWVNTNKIKKNRNIYALKIIYC